LRAAVAQISLSDDINANVAKIIAFSERAIEAGIDVVCFPECSLTGYIRDFSPVTNSDIELNLEKIQEKAARYRINMIVGSPYFVDEEMYNAAILINPDKSRRVYYKNILTEYDRKYFTAGKGNLTFTVNGVKCGVLICRDQNSPLLASCYAQNGSKAIFYLAAHYYSPPEAHRKYDKNRALPIARAVENNIYVLKANAVGREGEYLNLGSSLIVDPAGSVLQEADDTEETIIYVDI